MSTRGKICRRLTNMKWAITKAAGRQKKASSKIVYKCIFTPIICLLCSKSVVKFKNFEPHCLSFHTRGPNASKKTLENDHPVSFSNVSDTGEKVDVNFRGQKTTTFTNIHRTFADRHEHPHWHTNKVIDQPSAKLEDAAAE